MKTPPCESEAEFFASGLQELRHVNRQICDSYLLFQVLCVNKIFFVDFCENMQISFLAKSFCRKYPEISQSFNLARIYRQKFLSHLHLVILENYVLLHK